MSAYYNEIDPYAAQWLRNLIAAGLIAPGEVDERSIVDVRPADLAGFDQCHFFAGIGGWSYALRLAGWPDERPVWTGSCPCQPFSVAGKQRGFNDARHLWPEFRRLIAERRPPVVFGEQVASAAAWLAGVRGDLEALEYAVGALPVEAASVGAPHKRDRFWFVADADDRGGAPRRSGSEPRAGGEAHSRGAATVVAGAHRRDGQLAYPHGDGPQPRADDPAARHGHPAAADGWPGDLAHPDLPRPGEERPERGGQQRGPGRDPWAGAVWLTGADGKARRVEPGIRLLAHGVPARVGRLRAYGNAIVPQVAAEFIGAYLDTLDDGFFVGRV